MSTEESACGREGGSGTARCGRGEKVEAHLRACEVAQNEAQNGRGVPVELRVSLMQSELDQIDREAEIIGTNRNDLIVGVMCNRIDRYFY